MNKVIILLGPTGVGKTSVSMLLARKLRTEIISSDSMQIYKHMDIGTAKPSMKERNDVKHHMIDIVEPWDNYSAGEYIKNVRPVIDSLHSQDRIPVVVGGTGLYIKAMTRGIFTGPSADWILRNELLEKEKNEKGSLYKYLKSIDPSAASKIMPADTRRIVRALEVIMKCDETISQLQQTSTLPLPYEFIKIGISRSREELYRMIEQRIDIMIEAGLVEEVKRVVNMIKEHGGFALQDFFPSMQAIGYKETVLFLSGEISIEDAITLIKKRSRNYAKRQFTWFRKEDGIRWVDVTGLHDADTVFHKVKEALASCDIA